MNIIVNGEEQDISENATVNDLITQMHLAGRRLAIEINEEIVPRSAYEKHVLQTNDKIEIVHAIGGGQINNHRN